MKATRVNSRRSDIWQRWEHPDENASSYTYVNSCKGLWCALNQTPDALVLVLALHQNKQPRWKRRYSDKVSSFGHFAHRGQAGRATGR